MKIIVGILKTSSNQIQKYIDQGYHVEYIDDHVKNFANMLLKDASQEDLDKIRNSGYKITSKFWINMALLLAKNYDKIVIAGLQEEDYKKIFTRIV